MKGGLGDSQQGLQSDE